MSVEIEHSLRFGPRAASDIVDELGASQASFSRAVRALEQEGRVLRLGRARATRYGLLRPLPGVGEERFPIYLINELGDPQRIAELACIAPEEFALRPEAASESFVGRRIVREGFYPSLPFFLQQLRPEGFLGRARLRALDQDLGLPADLRNWSEDHVLSFLVRRGEDLSGAWIAGTASLERYFRQNYTPVDGTDGAGLAELARRALTGDAPGSSAGGEQPKFTAFLQPAPDAPPFHAIVKFSPPSNDPPARRWRDLLRAEALALKILHSAGCSVSPHRIVEHGAQVFLIVERFDRAGPRGRRPYIALGWLDDEFVGRRRSVRDSAERLHALQLISAADLASIQLASLFGDFIGNTDQHHGNTSFSWNEAGFFLAPLYDILPMFYAPDAQGQLRSDLHVLPVRFPELAQAYDRARALAADFWERIAGDFIFTAEFRQIARRYPA